MKYRKLSILVNILLILFLLNAFGNSIDGPIGELKEQFFLRQQHIFYWEIVIFLIAILNAWKTNKVVRISAIIIAFLTVGQMYLTKHVQYTAKCCAAEGIKPTDGESAH